MANNLISNGGSPFRLRRPRITTSGFVSEVDETVKSHLQELNEFLGKKIFRRETSREGVAAEEAALTEDFDRVGRIAEILPRELAEEFVEEVAENIVEDLAEDVAEDILEKVDGKTKKRSKPSKQPNERLRIVPEIRGLLASPLTPKRIPGENWARDSLVYRLKQAQVGNLTLSDYIDLTAELSELKYAF